MPDFAGRRTTIGGIQERAAAPKPTLGKRSLTEMLPSAAISAPVQRPASSAAAPVVTPERPRRNIADLFAEHPVSHRPPGRFRNTCLFTYAPWARSSPASLRPQVRKARVANHLGSLASVAVRRRHQAEYDT